MPFDRVMGGWNLLRRALTWHSAILCVQRGLAEEEHRGKGKRHPCTTVTTSLQEALKPGSFPGTIGYGFTGTETPSAEPASSIWLVSGEVQHLAPTLHLITCLLVGREGALYSPSLPDHFNVLMHEEDSSCSSEPALCAAHSLARLFHSFRGQGFLTRRPASLTLPHRRSTRLFMALAQLPCFSLILGHKPNWGA